jgi:hypothetical protein
MILRYLIIPDPHLRRAVTLWIVLAVAVTVKLGCFSDNFSVYRMFAGGARHWWHNQSLYASYTISEGLDGFRYSPAFAVAITPFVCLPGALGPIAWSLLSIGLLGWAMHVLVRDVLPGRWSTEHEARFLILTLLASAVGIWSLQSNALVTALLVLGLAAGLRQQWWKAALFLAVPVFIKLWPMALVLLLIVYWPRQLLGRFAAVCLALVLFPYLTRPPQIVVWQYREWYLSLTGPLLQGRWPGYRDAWTIWEEVCRLLAHKPDQALYEHLYAALSLVTALGVLAWCLWQGRRLAGKTAENSRGHLLMLILSMWSSWQLLFGPGTEQLTYGLIAPAASWAVLVSIAERRAIWLTCTAWAMVTFLPSGDIERSLLSIFPLARGLLPLGVVIFIAWLLWHERGAASCPAFAADEGAVSSPA